MSKCCVCGDPAEWAWQPFGPGESSYTFMLPGNHYRGFPALGVCGACKDDLQTGLPVEFEYKKGRYLIAHDEIFPIPEWVGDSLAWWAAGPPYGAA